MEIFHRREKYFLVNRLFEAARAEVPLSKLHLHELAGMGVHTERKKSDDVGSVDVIWNDGMTE